MAPPPRPSLSSSLSHLLTLVVLRSARCDAGPFQSDRPDDQGVDPHGARDLAEAPDEEVPNRNDPSFILDSGASHHATSDKWLLSEFAPLASEDTAEVIFTRGGRELPIAGAGTVVSENFQLPNVHYAPDLVPGTVLVSVPLLAAWGYHVMFGGGECIVMGGTGGKVVGQGHLQEGDGGLYHLDVLKIQLDAAAEQSK